VKRVRFKNITAYIFLALFLLIKMGGLHLLTHDNNQEHKTHCEICDLAIVNNFTPIVPSGQEDFTFTSVEFVVRNEIANYYVFFRYNPIASGQLFSRPPPFPLS